MPVGDSWVCTCWVRPVKVFEWLWVMGGIKRTSRIYSSDSVLVLHRPCTVCHLNSCFCVYIYIYSAIKKKKCILLVRSISIQNTNLNNMFCLCAFTHSLVLLLGFAEQFQDVDGSCFCDTVSPPWLCPLRWLSLGMVCFLFHNPGGRVKVSHRVCYFNSHTPCDESRTSSKLTWPSAERCVDSLSYHRTKYCRYPLQEKHKYCILHHVEEATWHETKLCAHEKVLK